MPKKEKSKKKKERKSAATDDAEKDALLKELYIQNKSRLKMGRLQDENAVLDDTAMVCH